MMKKILGTIFASAIMTALLVLGASAATEGYTTDGAGTVAYDSATGAYTATYSGTMPGEYYALLVVKKAPAGQSRSISDSTVMYIDQVAKSETISFTFIPRSTPDCEVLLGGVFPDGTTSPVLLGELTSRGSPVTGSVTYEGTTKPTVKLTSTTDATIEYAATFDVGSNNAYTFDAVPDGEYTLSITKTSHLPYSKTVTIDAENTTMTTVALLGGDVDTDHRYINTDDLSLLLTEFKNLDAVSHATNINEDGYVNVEDLSKLLFNFKATYTYD